MAGCSAPLLPDDPLPQTSLSQDMWPTWRIGSPYPNRGEHQVIPGIW